MKKNRGFCTYCGCKLPVDNTNSTKDSLKKIAGAVVDSAKVIGNNLNDATNGQAEELLADNTNNVDDSLQKTAETIADKNSPDPLSDNNMSYKKTKLGLSFIIGFVLNFITILLLLSHSVLGGLLMLGIAIMLWIGIGLFVYVITLQMFNSNGVSGLCGIILGGIGMWVLMGLFKAYFEKIEMAETWLGIFLLSLPITLVYTIIVYYISNAADKKPVNATDEESVNATDEKPVNTTDEKP